MAPKAHATLKFLRRLASLLAKENKLLGWTNALGLPVINAYFKPDIRRLGISHRGRRWQFRFTVGDTTEVKKGKAANAAAANFTHSVDATHLQMVATAAAKEGIPLATVHDCFGTIAPHAARLKEIIPEQFVRLHEHDLLGEILQSAAADLSKGAELPEPPERGTLDLEGIFNNNAFK
jgi:DNA-directed RNA polymerase